MRSINFSVLKLFLFILIRSYVQAYDDVNLEKTIPLVDKKAAPHVLRRDSQNRIWMINKTNQSIECVGQDGKSQVVLMPVKNASLGFKNPVDFGFLSDGSLLVADKGFARIIKISPEKILTESSVKEWKKFKIVQSFESKDVSAMAVSQDDIVAVANEGEASLAIFTPGGILLHRLFATEKYPIKEVKAMAYSPNGILWVLEAGKGVLHRFSPDRRWLGVTEGFESAQGIAVDEYGYAYITMGIGRWKEVSPDGVLSGVFGTKGKNPGELLAPSGVTMQEGTLCVAEAGNKRIQIFKVRNNEKKIRLFKEPAAYIQAQHQAQWPHPISDGLFLPSGEMLFLNNEKGKFDRVDSHGAIKSTWRKKSKGETRIVKPHSLALDAENNIWFSDEADHSLKLISDSGEITKTVGQKGKKEGSLKSPTHLVIRNDGSFVVVDKGNSRVQVLTPNGLFLFQVGSNGNKEGQFSSVAGVAANTDLIALLDSNRKALIFFNSSGKFSFEIANKEGKAPTWINPVSLATDTEGRFYILDKGANRVRIFNNKGQFLADVSVMGDKIKCGPQNKVLVLSEKGVSLYAFYLIPRACLNATAFEEAGELQVDWESNPEATEYAVYRASSAFFVPISKVKKPPFFDREAIPGILFTYAVVGVNSNGNEGNWALTNSIKAPKRKDVSLISIEKIDLKPVFTAASKFYVTNPVGEISLRNNDEIPFRNVKVSLGLKKYTDYPTEIIVSEIGPGEAKTTQVTLTFNDQIFELTEDTPVQMDIQVSYFEENEEKKVSQNAPITLYSRNSISWNDKARISSFITPKDPPVVEFTRAAIRDQMLLLKGATVGKPLAKAALFYEAINALGVSYAPDPKTPFDQASQKPDLLDYVQFPRETLRRKTGDCDDTTALLASLLESVGVSAALVDMPGHVLLMANTEETDINVLGLPEERFVNFEGTYWVPIETTKLGQGFLKAWQAGIAKVTSEMGKNSVQFARISNAALTYPPVTLVEVDKEGTVYPSEKVGKVFPGLLKDMEMERYQGKLKEINERIKLNPANRMLHIELGLIHVEGKNLSEGNKVFVSLLKEDEPLEVQAAARNNLGNLAYLEGNYKDAKIHYEKAQSLQPDDGGIYVNKARLAWKMGEKESIQPFLEKAKASLPEWQEFASDIPIEYFPK